MISLILVIQIELARKIGEPVPLNSAWHLIALFYIFAPVSKLAVNIPDYIRLSAFADAYSRRHDYCFSQTFAFTIFADVHSRRHAYCFSALSLHCVTFSWTES